MVLPSHAHIHMIAVCGTAMGSLAGMLRESGYRITGSDYHVYPPMSTFLADLGMEVQEGFNVILEYILPQLYFLKYFKLAMYS